MVETVEGRNAIMELTKDEYEKLMVLREKEKEKENKSYLQVIITTEVKKKIIDLVEEDNGVFKNMSVFTRFSLKFMIIILETFKREKRKFNDLKSLKQYLKLIYNFGDEKAEFL